MIDEIRQLIADIETGRRWLTKHIDPNETEYYTAHMGNVKFTSNDGWTIYVFFDCGDWDYFDSFSSPDRQGIAYEHLPPDIREYRPEPDIAKVMYGSPGCLGKWLSDWKWQND